MIRADLAEGLGDDVWASKLGGSLEAKPDVVQDAAVPSVCELRHMMMNSVGSTLS